MLFSIALLAVIMTISLLVVAAVFVAIVLAVAAIREQRR